jgi:hypothetical protein
MPSRQERRKAERDAAKRAPALVGAGGAGGAAAAGAGVNVIPLGDWTTQAKDPNVGPAVMRARLVIGCRLTQETRAQSAVNDVARDIRPTRPLGAGSSARSRGRDAEGRSRGGGSAVQPRLPVSE